MEGGEECSTRSILISLLEDIEIVSKELLEYVGTSRQARQDDVDPSQLIILLKQKDAEFQYYMKIAKEQEELQKEFDELKMEVEKRDAHVKFLQKNAKEAEDLLATITYDAKQKLKSIHQANSRKISSEELIKYAHKISAGNSVACPPDWVQGDLRRPYPTEVDMRQGLLSTTEHNKGGSQFGPDVRQLAGPQYPGMGGGPQAGVMGSSHSIPWQPSAEVQSTLLNRVPPTAETLSSNSSRMSRDYSQQHMPVHQHQSQSHKDEVELMSSDSSSSSSSDE